VENEHVIILTLCILIFGIHYIKMSGWLPVLDTLFCVGGRRVCRICGLHSLRHIQTANRSLITVYVVENYHNTYKLLLAL